MPDFSFRTIRELSIGLRRKEFSPVELLEDVIKRYEALEPLLNMFAFTDFEGALRQAKASETRMLKGQLYGDLDGIPTSVKDLIAVKDMPQRFGSRTASDIPMPFDAPSVERLRAAGAVILGKSTTSEFGCKAVGDSPLTGITYNPLNHDFTPGGSSAGAAAMVSSGLVPYAIGTDGGGSIRIPAALSGIFGIKAQFGRVAVYPTSATPTLAHVGPLSRTAGDSATVLATIAGFDSRDPFSLSGPQPDFLSTASVKRRLKIAWSPTLGYGRVDPQVAAITAKAVESIAAMGFEIEQVDHVFDDPIALWTAEFYAGVGTRLREIILKKPELIDPSVLILLKTALNQDMQAYYETVFERYAFREKVRQFFLLYDVLLTPTLPVAGVPVGVEVPPGYEDRNIVSWTTFTYPFNLTGNPSASMPVGTTKEGLPVGLQAISSAYDELSLLELASALERQLAL